MLASRVRAANGLIVERFFRDMECRSESWQPRLGLEEGDRIVSHSMLGIARKMVPRSPIMKGVRSPGDGEVLVIGLEVQIAIGLQKANHPYELVIGCWMIMIAVDRVNRFKAVRDGVWNQLDSVQGRFFKVVRSIGFGTCA